MVEHGGGRRKRWRRDDVVSSIQSFPQELIVDILVRVAAHSLDDLFNAKLSCRELKEMGDDSCVYKHASFAKIPLFRWQPETFQNKRKRCLFLQKCVNAGNLEALYRRGVVDYFECRAPEYALGCLKKAANAGHMASQYAICIISIFFEDEEPKKDGIISLGEMKSKESCKKVKTVRRKLKKILEMVLWRNNIFVAQKPICCTKHHRREKNNGWGPIDSDDEDSRVECKLCKVDLEISYFYKFLSK